jgi:hypothetical protein
MSISKIIVETVKLLIILGPASRWVLHQYEQQRRREEKKK